MTPTDLIMPWVLAWTRQVSGHKLFGVFTEVRPSKWYQVSLGPLPAVLNPLVGTQGRAEGHWGVTWAPESQVVMYTDGCISPSPKQISFGFVFFAKHLAMLRN